MSLQDVKGTPFMQKTPPKNTSPSTGYVNAVNQVRTSPKGTLISTKPQIKTAVPTVVRDVVDNPLGTLISGIGGIMFGTKEDKAKVIGSFIPAVSSKGYDIRTGETFITAPQSIKQQIDQMIKVNPEAEKFWRTPELPGGQTLPSLPEIKLPDILGGLGDIGKWVLLGGVALVGILLLTRGDK